MSGVAVHVPDPGDREAERGGRAQSGELQAHSKLVASAPEGDPGGCPLSSTCMCKHIQKENLAFIPYSVQTGDVSPDTCELQPGLSQQQTQRQRFEREWFICKGDILGILLEWRRQPDRIRHQRKKQRKIHSQEANPLRDQKLLC